MGYAKIPRVIDNIKRMRGPDRSLQWGMCSPMDHRQFWNLVGSRWIALVAFALIGLIAGEVNLLTDALPTEMEAKIRYRKKPACCVVQKEGDKLKVVFKEAQESITPGQAVVFYAGDEVLGGGVIEEVIRS